MDVFFGKESDNENLFLEKEELTHCLRVMRKQVGDRIVIINGEGGIWEAEINNQTSKTGLVTLIESKFNQSQPNYKFHLAVSPTKNSDRIEWLLEKAIETHLSNFTLIYTQRTERKHFNTSRLEKISIATLKQSKQLFLPKINESKFLSFIQNCQSEHKFIASCKNFEQNLPIQALSKLNDICVLIGPEGDFTDEEYRLAMELGFKPISLGNQRFRTETAALLVVMARFAY